MDIISQVEFRPSGRISAASDPDDRKASRDGGFQEIGAGDVRKGAHKGDKQGAVVFPHGLPDNQPGSLRIHRFPRRRKRPVRSPEKEILLRDIHQGKDFLKLYEALLHAVRRSVRPEMGGYEAHIFKTGGQKGMYHSERIIRLIFRIRIRDNTEHFFPGHLKFIILIPHF